MFGKKSYVGIDLGQHSIKAVQMDRTSAGWKVSKAGWVQTPKEAIKDGIVTNVEAVSSAVKALVKHAGISATKAIISVQGSSVVVRTVRMPKMSEAVLRKSIRFEAGRYVPTSVEDSYIEFEILGDVDDAQMEVQIVASPKDFVESRRQVCELIGLDVEVVDVSAFAVYRSVIEADDTKAWEDETFALIDLGSGSNTVSVVSNGVFIMTRAITSGNGAAFTEALRTFFDLSVEDSEAGKAALDVSELLAEKPKENPPLRVLHPYLDELVREIRRSINYYESQAVDGHAPKPIRQIVITGGGAKMTGISQYLSAKLGMEVSAAGAFTNPRIANGTAFDFGDGLDFSVAAGLAMLPTFRAA
jgi:type IV pilus assembly protein PilM